MRRSRWSEGPWRPPLPRDGASGSQSRSRQREHPAEAITTHARKTAHFGILPRADGDSAEGYGRLVAVLRRGCPDSQAITPLNMPGDGRAHAYANPNPNANGDANPAGTGVHTDALADVDSDVSTGAHAHSDAHGYAGSADADADSACQVTG